MCDDLSMVLADDFLNRGSGKMLILANKLDVWGAMSALDVERMLNLPVDNNAVAVIGCSALSGLNTEKALAWVLRPLQQPSIGL